MWPVRFHVPVEWIIHTREDTEYDLFEELSYLEISIRKYLEVGLRDVIL